MPDEQARDPVSGRFVVSAVIEGVLVDPEDEHFLGAYHWRPLRCDHTTYAHAGSGLLLHRLIMGAPPALQVDHRNGNGLDNRRANLRLATRHQQQGNQGSRGGTSRFKGVSWDKKSGSWLAQIRNPAKHYLGHFADEDAAARCYDMAAREFFGDFAQLNFPAEVCERA